MGQGNNTNSHLGVGHCYRGEENNSWQKSESKSKLEFKKQFQTDKTMLPFLAPDLLQLGLALMNRVIKSETFSKIKISSDFLHVDLKDDTIFKTAQLGFCTQSKDKSNERCITKRHSWFKICRKRDDQSSPFEVE